MPAAQIQNDISQAGLVPVAKDVGELDTWPTLTKSVGAGSAQVPATGEQMPNIPPANVNAANQHLPSVQEFAAISDPAERGWWLAREMDNLYKSEVRIASQDIFNSYHPATSRFLHDTWEPGKFVIAFNGVLSSTSPTVIRILYGNYYRQSCELNKVEHLCVPIEETLPWLQSEESLRKEVGPSRMVGGVTGA